MKILADQMNISMKKRKRTVLTAKQHKALSKSFEYCAFPTTEQRETLGELLNMEPRTVQIWFQNQRQKLKTQHSDLKSSQSTEESQESVENPRTFSPRKSLDTLAHLACIEYDRKFSKRENV